MIKVGISRYLWMISAGLTGALLFGCEVGPSGTEKLDPKDLGTQDVVTDGKAQVPSYDPEILEEMIKAANKCSKEGQGIADFYDCIEASNVKTGKVYILEESFESSNIKLDLRVIESPKGGQVFGAKFRGMQADFNYEGFLSSDTCGKENADKSESTKFYDKYRAKTSNQKGTPNTLDLDISTNSSGSAATYVGVGFDTIQAASFVFFEKDAPEKQSTTFCVSFDNIAEVQWISAEKQDKVVEPEEEVIDPSMKMEEQDPKVFFTSKVKLILQINCSGCHNSEGEKWQVSSDDDVFYDTIVDPIRYNADSPEESVFLIKAIGGLNHNGGPVFKLGDDNYKVLENFFMLVKGN